MIHAFSLFFSSLHSLSLSSLSLSSLFPSLPLCSIIIILIHIPPTTLQQHLQHPFNIPHPTPSYQPLTSTPTQTALKPPSHTARRNPSPIPYTYTNIYTHDATYSPNANFFFPKKQHNTTTTNHNNNNNKARKKWGFFSLLYFLSFFTCLLSFSDLM
jgi:hypothetical protein